MTPLAGKLGRLRTVISATTVDHEFENWNLGLSAEMVEVNGFEKTADADSNYWNSYLVGLCTGEANYSGKWNTAKNPVTSFKPGLATYTSLYCGLTSAVGFTLTGKNKSIKASTNVKQAGLFEGVFVVEGVTTYPT
jgi:hypothetical protein